MKQYRQILAPNNLLCADGAVKNLLTHRQQAADQWQHYTTTGQII